MKNRWAGTTSCPHSSSWPASQPPGLDGRSIAPLLTTGEPPTAAEGGAERHHPWREYLHSENSLQGAHNKMYPRLPGQQIIGNFAYEPSWHSLTDGKIKYIWWDSSGAEQLFDLVADPRERHDLSGEDEHADDLRTWRHRLAVILRDRPEGFSPDGHQLLPGRPHGRLSTNAQALMDQRIAEGYDIGYVYRRVPTTPADPRSQ